MKKKKGLTEFEKGILYGVARLIDLHGESTLAFDILNESGIDLKDLLDTTDDEDYDIKIIVDEMDDFNIE